MSFDEEYLGSGSLSDSDLEDVIRQAAIESDGGQDDPLTPLGHPMSAVADVATLAQGLSQGGSQDLDDDDVPSLRPSADVARPPDEAAEITSQLFAGAPQVLESEESGSKAQDIASEIPVESTEKAYGSGSEIFTGSKTTM
jgi:hypothetical protein